MSKKQAIASNEKVLQKLRQANDSNDPYLSTHGAQLQCKLCLTTHVSHGSYLLHTQGKRHIQELEARAKLDTKKPKPKGGISAVQPRTYVKIGLPKYTMTKVRAEDGRLGVLLNCKLPQIRPGTEPQYRFMSAFEQKVEPQDSTMSYLVLAAEPYDIIALKFKAKPQSDCWSFFDKDSREFYLQFLLT